MAITKTSAVVEGLIVLANGDVQARINYALNDGTNDLTRVHVTLTVSNATSGEKTAAASLVSKAAALAVA